MPQWSGDRQYWTVTKNSVSGSRGLVSTQHTAASETGAAILRNGGNAVDAAVAAGLVLGVVEPWMSGIGGGGYMTVYRAATHSIHVVEFGMRAPWDVRREDYPVVNQNPSEQGFNWPTVLEDRNVQGPLSIAVPGYVRGVSLALESFGTMAWSEVIAPACKQACHGVPLDWYACHHFSRLARKLAKYPDASRTVLRDGFPPIPEDASLPLGRLAETYGLLRDEGPDSYYCGTVAGRIAEDLESLGSRIRLHDLESYRAEIQDPLQSRYRDARLSVSGDLTAGPSLIYCLRDLEENWSCSSNMPDASAYVAYAASLLKAYKHRLEHLGDGADARIPSNTSHLCVTDVEGNLVSLTQTLLSGFGSKVLLPQTGIFMNNGMYWFDPRQGTPNSLAGGRRPLSNMCPAIAELQDASMVAIGACGGRTILPAVCQLLSFLVDFRLSVDLAVHQPRIDVSGMDLVTIMDSMDSLSSAALKERFSQVATRAHGVYPVLFGLPQLIRRRPSGEAEGGCFIYSPHTRVVAA